MCECTWLSSCAKPVVNCATLWVPVLPRVCTGHAMSAERFVLRRPRYAQLKRAHAHAHTLGVAALRGNPGERTPAPHCHCDCTGTVRSMRSLGVLDCLRDVLLLRHGGHGAPFEIVTAGVMEDALTAVGNLARCGLCGLSACMRARACVCVLVHVCARVFMWVCVWV
jgi:hypothetical protein